MKITDIYNIFRQIVIDSPYRKGGGQLNSFAVLDQLSQLNAANEEMSFRDYQKGLFWSRAAANQGGTTSNIKLEYDLLYIETVKSSNLESPFSNEICHPFFISVASPVECDGCESRTIPDIDDRNLVNLQAAIKEFLTYGLYDITFDGLIDLAGNKLLTLTEQEILGLNGQDATLWLSAGRANYINSIVEGKVVRGPKKAISSYLQPGPLEIFQGGKYIDNLRIKTVEITICDCADEVAEYNYKELDFEELLMLKCDSC